MYLLFERIEYAILFQLFPHFPLGVHLCSLDILQQPLWWFLTFYLLTYSWSHCKVLTGRSKPPTICKIQVSYSRALSLDKKTSRSRRIILHPFMWLENITCKLIMWLQPDKVVQHSLSIKNPTRLFFWMNGT